MCDMREMVEDPFYQLIGNYKNCIIDYCLIADDTPYQGKRSHKDAILFAMLKVIERYIEEQLRSEIKYREQIGDEPFPWNLDIGKAQAKLIDSASLLYVPQILSTDYHGNKTYDVPYPNTNKGEQIPYWYAFWETPHGSGYGPEDFRKINSVLFPGGPDVLEVYEWTTDWSNYFDDGHEWWGTACWSVYDKQSNRYVVIMASTTD